MVNTILAKKTGRRHVHKNKHIKIKAQLGDREKFVKHEGNEETNYLTSFNKFEHTFHTFNGTIHLTLFLDQISILFQTDITSIPGCWHQHPYRSLFCCSKWSTVINKGRFMYKNDTPVEITNSQRM